MTFTYRIQVIHDYAYYDATYDTIKELMAVWAERLDLTRAKIRGMIERKGLRNMHPHILITRNDVVSPE